MKTNQIKRSDIIHEKRVKPIINFLYLMAGISEALNIITLGFFKQKIIKINSFIQKKTIVLIVKK